MEEEVKKSNWKKNLLYLIIIFFIIGLVKSDLKTSEKASVEEAVERTTEYFEGEEWKDFSSTIGQFKALFPSYPIHETETLPISLFGYDIEMKIDSYMAWEEETEMFYMVGVVMYKFDFEPDLSDPEYLLESGLNGLVASTEGNKLISSDFTTFNGYNAIDFLVWNEDLDFYMKGKVILVETTVYELMVGYDSEDYQASDYNKFINSFQLLE